MLKRSLNTIAVSLLAVAGSIAASAPASAAERVYIPFADKGGIDDWRAVDDRVLYLRSRMGQWYKAATFGPCDGLRFSERIAYKSEADGSFDDKSSIIVDGRECRLQTLVKSEPPPKR